MAATTTARTMVKTEATRAKTTARMVRDSKAKANRVKDNKAKVSKVKDNKVKANRVRDSKAKVSRVRDSKVKVVKARADSVEDVDADVAVSTSPSLLPATSSRKVTNARFEEEHGNQGVLFWKRHEALHVVVMVLSSLWHDLELNDIDPITNPARRVCGRALSLYGG
jgi:hypothetical protein